MKRQFWDYKLSDCTDATQFTGNTEAQSPQDQCLAHCSLIGALGQSVLCTKWGQAGQEPHRRSTSRYSCLGSSASTACYLQKGQTQFLWKTLEQKGNRVLLRGAEMIIRRTQPSRVRSSRVGESEIFTVLALFLRKPFCLLGSNAKPCPPSGIMCQFSMHVMPPLTSVLVLQSWRFSQQKACTKVLRTDEAHGPTPALPS